MGACVFSAARGGRTNTAGAAPHFASCRSSSGVLGLSPHQTPRWFVCPARWFIAAIVLAALIHSPAAAGPYSLQVIAQAGDVIDGRTIVGFSSEYTNVAINNDGEVAYFAYASGPEGSGYSVLTQRRFIAGAGKIVDGTTPGFNDEDHQVDINASGQVVYTGFLPQGGRGLFVNEDLILKPGDVVDGRTVSFVFRYPQINDTGTVVVDGRYFVGDGTEHTAIFQRDSDLAHSGHGDFTILANSGQMIDGFTLGVTISPRIGNSGQVVFLGGLAETDRSAAVTPSRIALKIGDEVDGEVIDYVYISYQITDSDEIITHVRLGVPPGAGDAVVTQDRIIFRSGDLVMGRPFLQTGSQVVVNSKGEFAIAGAWDLRKSGRPWDVLLVDGEIVTYEGAQWNGKEIAEIFYNFDMNDHGQVAFRVEFDDGTRAVMLATPVPEPASASLMSSGILIFLVLIVRRSSSRRGRAIAIQS